MRKICNKGHRIRASDKQLVYHFSIGTLLFVFVAVLLLLNTKQLMRTDWEHFSLLENGLTLSPYNFITILIATGIMWIYKILIYGGVILKKAMIYVHGKGGSYLEAEQFKNICLDFDVFGVDYNDYFPWIVKNKIMEVYDKISEKYDYIYVLANSIGAYFTMHTLQNFKIEKALFISPILDMEQLIVDMMSWANVSEKELSERKEIPTDFGETLSWEYLCFVRANPINWKTPTEILYAEHDNLTSRQTVDKFIDRHCANLTVMNDGEHWFHTDEQIFFRDNWLRKVIQ